MNKIPLNHTVAAQMIYAQFRDGSTYHLQNATIKYFPNQNLIYSAGANPCYGITKSTPITEPYQLDKKYYILPFSPATYLLKFSNKSTKKFENESFFINDIEFILMSSSFNGCEALGRITTKNHQ